MELRGKRTRTERRSFSFSVLPLFLCLAILFTAFLPAARAADLTRGNCAIEFLNNCSIYVPKDNRYDGSRPVIVFLPGITESDNINETAYWMRRHKVYDDVDADIVAAAFWEEPEGFFPWKLMARDLRACLEKKQGEKPFPVIIDAVSVSGYGACCLAQFLVEDGIPVQEINLAEACDCSFITAEWLADLAAAGVRVNIWIGSDTENWSKKSRSIAAELKDTENVNSVVLNVTHGLELDAAVHEYGLHEELLAE